MYYSVNVLYINKYMDILKLYKNRGETPLECIERFKRENPKYKEEKMTYAGRLDPLAEGLLLVLVGEECKNKEKYLGLDKEYYVDILFGFSTDTHDVLGLVKSKADNVYKTNPKEISKILKGFVGKFSQKYPAFSSKTINGEAMFDLSKKGKIDEEEIPEKEVEIKNIDLINKYFVTKDDLEKYIKKSINSVNGDFRQEEIYKTWQMTLDDSTLDEFMVLSMKVNCTSGTYMRLLADNIGKKIGIPTLALNINRTKIGDFKIK